MEVEIFGDAEELLNKIHPDVVHVVTPPKTHEALVNLSLSHGAHVFAEKPFVLGRSVAESIVARAEGMGRKLCAGHQLLFEHPAVMASNVLKEIGSIVHVESYFSFRPVRRSADGGGSISPINQLIDILPHPVYLLLDFLRAGNPAGMNDDIEITSVTARSGGDVHAIFRMGKTTGVLVVTLNGRPIESYLRVVGTNGCLFADFVHGFTSKLAGPGSSAIPIILSPYKQSRQVVLGSIRGFGRLLSSRKRKVYPGLSELIGAFYGSILDGSKPPISHRSIIETVGACETITEKLRVDEKETERIAETGLEAGERRLVPPDPSLGTVLVSGGTGFLGRVVAAELRKHGWKVRVISRRVPPATMRLPGVEYMAADLGTTIPSEIFYSVDTVVHCAAETAGNKKAHERNSILATENILDAAAGNGVRKFLHISSVAVLKTGRDVRRPIDESTPVDAGNLARGPYVWGKAESEVLALKKASEKGIVIRILRLGPLVDYMEFEPPGRLGREVGGRFICMGNRESRLSVCDVHMAAEVIRYYVAKFEQAPPVLNLLEPEAPNRRDLVNRLIRRRPDLKPLWVPTVAIRVLAPFLVFLQSVLIRNRTPIDIGAAFASEEYDCTLAGKVTEAAKSMPSNASGRPV